LLYEVRWHGRGGQGVVTSSELLALSALKEGLYVYHAPEFGPERRGAPVRAYTRISDEPIEQHYGIYTPDAVIVIDPTLQSEVDYVMQGLKEGGLIVLNAKTPNSEIVERAKKLGAEIWVVDAYKIAMDIFGRPFYNTPMLGAFTKVWGRIKLDNVLESIREKFGERGEEIVKLNIEAVKKAYEEVKKYEY